MKGTRMACLMTLEDDQGHELVTLATARDKYLLPDGSQMFVDDVPAWCRQCGTFIRAEKFSTPEELERKAREWFDTHANRPGIPYEFLSKEKQDASNLELLNQGLNEAVQWRKALATRTSPPRCLKCGGIDFVAFPTDGTWTTHPGEPGRKVRVAGISLATMAGYGNLYDTNGRRIPDRHAD
jgi:hypothetical protein